MRIMLMLLVSIAACRAETPEHFRYVNCGDLPERYVAECMAAKYGSAK